MLLRFIFIFLLSSSVNCLLNGQETIQLKERKWSIGIEYRPFNYTLHNYGEVPYLPRHQLNNFNFQSAQYGINLRKNIQTGYFIETNFDYSHTRYEDMAAGERLSRWEEPLFAWDRKNTVKTKNLHLSLTAGYQLPLNRKKDYGLDMRLGVIGSYNLDYYIHFTRYEFPNEDRVLEGPVNLTATEMPYHYESIYFTYNEATGEAEHVETRTFERPYIFNRFTMGVEAGISFYYNISDRIYLSSGIWISRDFTRAVIEDYTPNQDMFHRRWGVSLEVAYMF